MPGEVTFRPVWSMDWEHAQEALLTVAKIRNQGREWYTNDTEWISPLKQIQWYRAQPRDLWVAERDDQIVGFALLDHRPDGTTWISLGVDPAAQGSGVGTAIYAQFPSFAEIRADNVASRRAAEKARYALVRDEGDKVVMSG